LGDLDLSLQIAFKARIKNFPLRRLEAINKTRDASNIARIRELDELLIDEILVTDKAVIIVIDSNIVFTVKSTKKPLTSMLSSLLVKNHI